jgi:L-asparaginase
LDGKENYNLEIKRICVLSTGGTIACKFDSETGGLVPILEGEELIQQLNLPRAIRVEVDNFSKIAGYFSKSEWLSLAKRIEYHRPHFDGIVITQGTDTLEETSFFLSLFFGDSQKPIILTGAQISANQLSSDGPRNLRDAIVAASSNLVRGTTVVFNGKILDSKYVRKNHTTDLHGFVSEYGEIGIILDNKVKIQTSIPSSIVYPIPETLEEVDIFQCYSNVNPKWLNEMLHEKRGIVIQALGCGNVTSEVYDQLKKYPDKIILVAKRAPEGYVIPIYSYPGGGRTLYDAGVIFMEDLSAFKSRILVMVLLALFKDRDQVKDEIQRYIH